MPENINSFEEFKMHPIYNKILVEYPILNKYSKNINNNINIKLNYYNESISNTISNDILIILIRFLVDFTQHQLRKDKVIMALLIYEIILNHEKFLLDNKRFLSTCLNKIEEFKKSNYDDFDELKLYNNNINPLDTIIDKFNKLNNISENILDNILDNKINIPEEILSKYKLIYDSEINDKIAKQKLKLNNCRNFNFKTNYNILNEEEFNILFGIYLDILLTADKNYNIVITYTLIFELFINNIEFIKKDELLKTFLSNKIKELIKTNFSDFENIKIYNYNKNPLETVINLIRFCF